MCLGEQHFEGCVDAKGLMLRLGGWRRTEADGVWKSRACGEGPNPERRSWNWLMSNLGR